MSQKINQKVREKTANRLAIFCFGDAKWI